MKIFITRISGPLIQGGGYGRTFLYMYIDDKIMVFYCYAKKLGQLAIQIKHSLRRKKFNVLSGIQIHFDLYHPASSWLFGLRKGGQDL